MTGSSAPEAEGLAAGRAACERADWRAAFALLTAADAQSPLGCDDLIRAGEAAMWSGEHDACIELRQRAFAALVADDESQRAAELAIELCMDHVHRHRMAVAIGWLQRAETLVADREPCRELGLLNCLRASVALDLEHDTDAAARFNEAAIAIGRACRDADIVALGLVGAGTVQVRIGKIAEGLRMADEAMTDAVSGLLSPITAARVYCSTIGLCQALGDVRRAYEWTEEAVTCASRPGMTGFPGDCRLHRAEITRLRGDWQSAEAEVRRAMQDLENWDLSHVAHGWYELGEIALRRGDLTAADEAFTQAVALGKDPQPGLAHLRVAQGQPAEAGALLRTAIEHAGDADPLAVAQYLPVLIEALIAGGDTARAGAAANDLAEIASRYGTVVLNARAATARARVALASGSDTDTVTAGRAAINLWRDAGAPYETAQAQRIVAAASARAGDREVAIVEIEAAIAAFESLGATADAEDARRLRDRFGHDTTGPRVRRTFMFTDVVDSTRLLTAMGDQSWSSVLRWHDATIRDLLARHAGFEVKQRGGGDGFFAVFESPIHAIDCAIAVQRRLAQHREEHGFAPEIRIGVHEADALQCGEDYAGLGVHEAARISAIADAGEILASVSTVTAASAPTQAPPREVELKGIAGRVAVQPVAWEGDR